VNSTIDLEDSASGGFDDAAALDRNDVAIGITASGATAYVGGALRCAREAGALTVLITCNPAAPLADLAEVLIVADTGAEALTGSTRLKAGTATKVILNSFSTALMIRSGRTFSNLMVGLVATNDKLRERAIALLVEATARPQEECRDALERAGGAIPVALVSLASGSSIDVATRALAATRTARDAIASLSGAGT
jgi:N-acetylmuramic acid 6-phosphate etherase